jgi:hypothetical protein
MELTIARALAFVGPISSRNVDQLLIGEPADVAGLCRFHTRKGNKAKK